MLAHLPSPPRGVWYLGSIPIRAYALCIIAAYTVGRAWIEALPIDHANHLLGLRLNDWTSLVVFVAVIAFLLLCRPRREQPQAATAARQ
jgi:prolipoprotein diacylglyceryltransferase